MKHVLVEYMNYSFANDCRMNVEVGVSDYDISVLTNSDKRKKELERTAREIVDHSLLEPVSRIFEETYSGYTPDSSGAAPADAVLLQRSWKRECRNPTWKQATRSSSSRTQVGMCLSE
jgi:hypothetical protein